MSNKRKINYIAFVIGIAVVFAPPLFFYFYYINKLKTHKPLPPHYFVSDGVDSHKVNGAVVYDTIYHTVADLELTNQLGRVVSLNKDLKDKILVVDFFFVNCPSICPRLTKSMVLLQRAFKKNDSTIHLVSITVNPGHDSFAVLRTYADHYGANHDHWWFLTGDKKVIYEYARHQLFVEATPGDGGENDFIHSQKLVLLDRDRHIRGYYDGLDSAEVKRCADDIGLLSIEREKQQLRKH